MVRTTSSIAIFLFFVFTVTLHAAHSDTTWTNRHLQRNLLVGNVAILGSAYAYSTHLWGAPDGKFHFKNDLHDNLAMTDEISHMFAAYKFAEGFRWLFRITRMQPDKLDKYSLLEAGLITTLVEYPLDAYNPDQGFGVSDLIFDWAGVGFAWLRWHGMQQFDLKFSLKRSPFDFQNKLLASSNNEFDNYIWWANWKPKYVWLGLGYGTNHDSGHVKSEYYLGAGTTLCDLLGLFDKELADKLKALDSYFINLKVRL
jgi:hypothetical protein